jgi:hypothetical protein
MRIIQSAYKFIVGPLYFSFSAINHIITYKFRAYFFPVPAKAKHHIIFSYLMNVNLVNDQHSALEISDLSELKVHFSRTG